MMFADVLSEAPLNLPEQDLKVWNEKQLQVWNEIARLKGFKKGTSEYFNFFIKFATVFDKEYKETFSKTHELPSDMSIVKEFI